MLILHKTLFKLIHQHKLLNPKKFFQFWFGMESHTLANALNFIMNKVGLDQFQGMSWAFWFIGKK